MKIKIISDAEGCIKYEADGIERAVYAGSFSTKDEILDKIKSAELVHARENERVAMVGKEYEVQI